MRHPNILPVDQIEPAFANLVAICTELPTPSGFVDNLFLTEIDEASSLCANMTETSCVTAMSEQGGKETQHGIYERHCSPGDTRVGDIRFCIE
jgi:hypothetical protein